VIVANWFVYDVFMAIPMGFIPPALDELCRVAVGLVNCAFVLFALVWQLFSLAFAYRSYIRMPHAWGVAIAAHLAGTLLGLIMVAWTNLILGG